MFIIVIVDLDFPNTARTYFISCSILPSMTQTILLYYSVDQYSPNFGRAPYEKDKDNRVNKHGVNIIIVSYHHMATSILP